MLCLHRDPLDLGDFGNDANRARCEALPFALRFSAAHDGLFTVARKALVGPGVRKV